MIEPIYVCFFTIGTLYEQEAARLRASLDALGLAHDIRGVQSVGDWVANTRRTAVFICEMLAAHEDRPVVYLDADAFVYSRPVLFDQMTADVAVHYRKGRELLNGTAFFNVGPAARMVAETYRDFIVANAGCTNEQLMLDAAIGACAECVNVYKLPPSYTFIADIMKDDLSPGEEPVIEHLQASRERNHCEAWGRRRKRVEAVEKLL
jgi:hypothetical protein